VENASDPASDEDLARRAGAGDRAALEALLARHLDQVYAVCRRVLGHPEDAADATQEALIAITRGISRFDGRSRFTTWMYRVATNAALDEARRRRRRPIASEHLDEISTVADPTAAVDARLDVDAALATIPPDYRAAVALRDLVGLDYAEIASVLDIPIGTVRSRIARGRAALADRLSERDLSERGLSQRDLSERTGNRDDPTERPTPRVPRPTKRPPTPSHRDPSPSTPTSRPSTRRTSDSARNSTARPRRKPSPARPRPSTPSAAKSLRRHAICSRSHRSRSTTSPVGACCARRSPNCRPPDHAAPAACIA